MALKENVLSKTSDFLVWFLPKVDRFPRNYKFLVGDRLVQMQMDLLEDFIDASYRQDKLASLRRANLRIEKLRRLLPVCAAMKFISLGQLEYATRALNEIGSMTGGWIRQQQSRESR